ncbi:hypothetical protein Dip510_000712 [Elusimicrobium posterum]|uniref:trypsin-like serine protease n=1 Tax=Elusimicrobium posterum TaxID=3116653 RepID=UPI003C70B289
MKKLILPFFIILILSLPCRSEVSFISVTGMDYFTKPQDFASTYSIETRKIGLSKEQKKNEISSCQAIKIRRNWFLTAAHCVTSCIENCNVQINIYEDSRYLVFTGVKHTQKNKTVFFDHKFKSHSLVNTDIQDFALIKYGAGKQQLMVLDKNQRVIYKAADFITMVKGGDKIIRAARDRNSIVENLPLVYFDNNYHKLNRILTFIYLIDNKKEVRMSGDFETDPDANKNPVYYLKRTTNIMLKNFGAVPGTSGAGIMTNTGEIAGINSFYTVLQITGKNGKKQEVQYAGFATFNDKTIEFMKNIMGADFDSLEIKDARETKMSEKINFIKMPDEMQHFDNQKRD